MKKFYSYNMHNGRILKDWKVADSMGNEVCVIARDNPEPVTTAHLLAAAPEILSALEAIVSHWKHNDQKYYSSDLCTDALEAIRTAKQGW